MADAIGQISISTERWNRNLALLAQTLGENMTETLNEEFPLLLYKIIDFTPPNTLAQGRQAVASDISKVMRPFDPANVKTEGIREIVERQDIAAFNIVAQRAKSGYMHGARAIPFDSAYHIAERTDRGRVGGKDRNQVVLGADAGLLKKYVRAVQDRVGYAKSGWLKALHAVGGVAQGFVEKHGTGGGDMIDNRKDEDPSITAINRTPWAERQDEGARIIKDAIQSRANAIFTKTRTKMRLAVKQAGFDIAA